MLVNWEIEQAAQNKIVIVVETVSARNFYLKNGFKILGQNLFGPVTMPVLLWKPPGFDEATDGE
jgi:hypothetical protein